MSRELAAPTINLVLLPCAQSSDIGGRTIVIMVWQKGIGFDHNQGIGGAEINLEGMCLRQQSCAWYPLFPMHSFGSDSNDSP